MFDCGKTYTRSRALSRRADLCFSPNLCRLIMKERVTREAAGRVSLRCAINNNVDSVHTMQFTAREPSIRCDPPDDRTQHRCGSAPALAHYSSDSLHPY